MRISDWSSDVCSSDLWLSANLDVRAVRGEWSSDEIYIALPKPGGDAWLAIRLADGRVEYEHTDRGWIAWLNDLHKGRNTGAIWSGFIDVFAVACLVFCLSGLFLLQLQARRRRSRSEEHTSELQSLMRISYAVF